MKQWVSGGVERHHIVCHGTRSWWEASIHLTDSDTFWAVKHNLVYWHVYWISFLSFFLFFFLLSFKMRQWHNGNERGEGRRKCERHVCLSSYMLGNIFFSIFFLFFAPQKSLNNSFFTLLPWNGVILPPLQKSHRSYMKIASKHTQSVRP